MTPFQIAIPESLTSQRADLEAKLAGIAAEEQKLTAQRKDIQVALESITTAVAVLSGQPLPASKGATPTGRKQMSPEARLRIAEGIQKAAKARAAAKAAQGAAPADAQVVPLVPQAPAPAPADKAEPNTKREERTPKKPMMVQ